jgi:hypothetical protein
MSFLKSTKQKAAPRRPFRIHLIVCFRRPPTPSAFCASRGDPLHRGRWRTVGERREWDRVKGYRDPKRAGGHGGLEATVPNGKRKPFCAVPDARRAEVKSKSFR